MRKLCLELVGGSYFSFTALLLLSDNFSVDTKLEDAAIQLDCVLDPLEILVDALHALYLTNVGSNTLWVFADCVNLFLKPVLLILDTLFHDSRQLLAKNGQAILGHRQ